MRLTPVDADAPVSLAAVKRLSWTGQALGQPTLPAHSGDPCMALCHFDRFLIGPSNHETDGVALT